MVRIPEFLFKDKIKIKTYEGESGTGPLYKEPKSVKCRVDWEEELVTSDNGEEVTSSAQVIFCNKEYKGSIPKKSIVIIDGNDYIVEKVNIKKSPKIKGEAFGYKKLHLL